MEEASRAAQGTAVPSALMTWSSKHIRLDLNNGGDKISAPISRHPLMHRCRKSHVLAYARRRTLSHPLINASHHSALADAIALHQELQTLEVNSSPSTLLTLESSKPSSLSCGADSLYFISASSAGNLSFYSGRSFLIPLGGMG